MHDLLTDLKHLSFCLLKAFMIFFSLGGEKAKRAAELHAFSEGDSNFAEYVYKFCIADS